MALKTARIEPSAEILEGETSIMMFFEASGGELLFGGGVGVRVDRRSLLEAHDSNFKI